MTVAVTSILEDTAVVRSAEVRAFAAATLDHDSPQGSVPPLFAARLAAPVIRRVLAGVLADRAGPVVHVAQEVVCHGRLEVGQEVAVRGRLVELVDYGIAPAAVIETVVEAAGRLSTSTSTMLLPGRRRAGTRPNRAARVVAGELFANTDVMLPEDLANRYAEASGDHNPIHTDPAVAQAVGLPGVVLHGMCTLAVLWAESGRLAGGRPVRASCRFADPVRPGEPLAISLHRTDRPGMALADVRQRGRAVLKSAVLEFSEESSAG